MKKRGSRATRHSSSASGSKKSTKKATKKSSMGAGGTPAIEASHPRMLAAPEGAGPGVEPLSKFEFLPRFKIRFPSREAMQAATSMEAPGVEEEISNAKRAFISVKSASETAESRFHAQLDKFASEYGARIVEDYRYELESDVFDVENVQDDSSGHPSLDDVLTMIRANEAWQYGRGGDVSIAIVDTGVDGNRPEFPAAKRAGSWEPPGDTPWTDWHGHGTMCAAIACGTRGSGGAFDGVAPDAKLIACRTRFYDSELAAIYDFLIERAATGETIVASNSFGRKTGAPPPRPQDSDFIPALDEAIRAGIHVFFSAGNNHQRAGGDPDGCGPNSVWLHKSRHDVFAVATCKLDESMWFYSSRGPGQFIEEAGANQKPDVTAPTPRNGRVVYGSEIKTLANGWGTSGACPQVAGLAALLLSRRPFLTRDQLFGKIKEFSRDLGHASTCQGAGIIDCAAAMSAVFVP